MHAAAGKPLASSKARVPAMWPCLDAGGLPPGAAAPSTITIDPAVDQRQRPQRAAGFSLDADQVEAPLRSLKRAVMACGVSAWRCGGGGLVEALFARRPVSYWLAPRHACRRRAHLPMPVASRPARQRRPPSR